MKSTLNTFIFGIILLIIAAVAYITATKFVKNQAIDGCLQTARLEGTAANGQKAITPENYWYTFCMKEKGYK